MRLVLVVGQAQQGKTTLALRLLTRSAQRLLILDPVRSSPFDSLLREGGQSFPTFAALASFLASAQGSWKAILRSIDLNDYTQALKHARHYRHVTILADEALYFTTDPVTLECLVKVARANAHFGGGLGVPLWVTAQRPMDVPPNVRSQATQFISFRQEEPADLAFLSQRCTPSFAEQVSTLRDHEWLAYPPLPEAWLSEHLKGVKYNGGSQTSPP